MQNKNTQPIIEKNGNELLVQSGAHKIHLRYAEISREKEAIENGEESIGESEKEQKAEHDRVSAELHLKFDREINGVPKNQWIKLADVYCHDSYDGRFDLVLEDATVYDHVLEAAINSLDIKTDRKEFLKLCASHTAYTDGFNLLIDSWDDFVTKRNDIEIVKDVTAEPSVDESQTDNDTLFSKAKELLLKGIENGEKLDSYDAYKPYNEFFKVSEYAEPSPCFAKAQDILLQMDKTDTSGRSHALRGWWYEQEEYKNFPRTVYETAKAYNKAVECAPENLEWIRLSAFAHCRCGKYAPAIKMFNQLIKADKNNSQMYFLRGICYRQSAKWDNALKDIGKAIELDGNDERAYEERAKVYDHIAKKAEALQDRNKANELRDNPNAMKFKSYASDHTMRSINLLLAKAIEKQDRGEQAGFKTLKMWLHNLSVHVG